MKVLIVSNLDSARPFGQFLRPFHLGRGLSRLGVEVANVGVNCSAVDFGPAWSTHAKSLRPYIAAARQAARRFRPDVIYGHEARGGTAAILASVGVPVAVDYHALPSLEWRGYARSADGPRAALYRLAALRSAAGERLMARRADVIISAGDELAEDLERRHQPSVAPVVVPNGVSADLLDRAPSASPYPSRARTAVATVPASVSEANTRSLAFLQAVTQCLAEQDSGIDVHVVGSDSGPTAPRLHYQGYHDILRGDGAAWISHADVCLLPYPANAAYAGGPKNKLLEYLSLGRTLVTTQEGLRGLREVAEWPGVTLTSDDPDAFAAAVVAAARSDVPRLDAVRPLVRERLRWEVLAERVRDALADALVASG
jgi:glycosyltransferase involved in cell wall biosynthesis